MKVAIQKKDNYPVLKDDYPENFRKLQERYQAALKGKLTFTLSLDSQCYRFIYSGYTTYYGT